MEPTPNSPVLIGPRWRPATALYSDDEGVHVMHEGGAYEVHPPHCVAVRGAKVKAGDEVLVERQGKWSRTKILDTQRGRVRVDSPEGGEWLEREAIAKVLAKAKLPSQSGGAEAEDADEALPFGLRLRRFGLRYGAFVLLGLALPAPLLLMMPEGGGPTPALAWVCTHLILAAYVHADNRPLPRFHPAGFGKPSNPHVDAPGCVIEHPPLRGKWEVTLFVIMTWVTLGLGAVLPGVAPWIPASLALVPGTILATLTYLAQRDSATDAGRLLAAPEITDGARLDEGRITGTLAGTPGPKAPVSREVMLYEWSTSQQVSRVETDANGNSRTVQVTETSHHSCGLRREQMPAQLRLDTPLGPVEVPLRGAVWAAERVVRFGRASKAKDITRDCPVSALEVIEPGDGVVVLGTPRFDNDGGRMVGGPSGPMVVFAAGKGLDVRARLSTHMLRRRALIAAMVVLALPPLISLIW